MFSYGKDGTWWRVLTIDKENYTALVIADSSIAKKEYNVTKGSITWENCSLRNWLNNIYFEESFSEEEKDSIIDTDVINSDNAKYNTKGGNNTKDKIWLLSIDETKMYFENNEECSMGCWWWLRSPGIYDCGAATVDNDGCVSEFGSSVYDGNGAVRPAFWINLKSSFFQAMTTDFEKLNILVPNYTLFGKKICKVRPGIKKLIISEGVESIGEKALCHCKKLESITIPNGVAYIGNGAFCGCISLKSITIPEGITEIPEDCFKNANSLNTIALPNTIKKIKKEAFCGCTNLEIITGTNGSITYETGVFDGCSKLKYTPEMFHNTGKLCDSFANNLELCGPEEYAWIIMNQKGKIWNEVISKTINEKNATEVLRYIIEHILKIKKSPKKVASVATEFVIKNVLILSADRINELIKVLQNEMLTELSDKLLADPVVKTIVNHKENNTCEMKSEPQMQRTDGSIWYGSNPVPLAVGTIITFGLNTTNWRVLSIDIANDTAIVISDDYICRKEYNNRFENVNWERSSLRKWLNGEYLNTYFMPDEKEAILEAYISKQGNIEYLKRDDNDINDKIWLLNIEEVRKYFENNKDRSIGYRWWLRSLGHNNISAACVDSAGSVSEYGYYVNECAVVRPAFIIDFKASILKSRISINSDGETIINNPEFVVKNGKVIGIGGNLTEIEFPSFVTEIPGKLLCKAKKLKSVVIPESIKKVESYAFAGCTSLEKIEIRNSNLIFDKNVFGEDNDRSEATNIIPEGLRSDIYDIGIHMAIEDIRDIILNDEIWSKLNPKQQAKLFIQRQSENLKKTYKALLTEKNSYQMAEAIAEEINKDFSKKECNTVAFFMTEFSDLISVNVAKTIYSKLKECKRSDMAIKTIESCEVIMFRINASDSGKIIMTKEEQILQNTLEALGYTRRSVEINLKEYFNIEKMIFQ